MPLTQYFSSYLFLPGPSPLYSSPFILVPGTYRKPFVDLGREGGSAELTEQNWGEPHTGGPFSTEILRAKTGSQRAVRSVANKGQVNEIQQCT